MEDPQAPVGCGDHGEDRAERLAARNMERGHIERGIETRTRRGPGVTHRVLHRSVHLPVSSLDSRARILSCSAVYSGAKVSELNASRSTCRASSDERSAASWIAILPTAVASIGWLTSISQKPRTSVSKVSSG